MEFMAASELHDTLGPESSFDPTTFTIIATPTITRGIPWIIFHWAALVDGKVLPFKKMLGIRIQICGAEGTNVLGKHSLRLIIILLYISHRHVHSQRAQFCAISAENSKIEPIEEQLNGTLRDEEREMQSRSQAREFENDDGIPTYGSAVRHTMDTVEPCVHLSRGTHVQRHRHRHFCIVERHKRVREPNCHKSPKMGIRRKERGEEPKACEGRVLKGLIGILFSSKDAHLSTDH